MLPPEERHKAKEERRQLKQEKLEEQLAISRELHDEFRRLVLSKGYRYLKSVGLNQVLAPYACDPPKTDAEKEKWATYNTVRWAFERLFALVEKTAKGDAPELPKGLLNDNQ